MFPLCYIKSLYTSPFSEKKYNFCSLTDFSNCNTERSNWLNYFCFTFFWFLLDAPAFPSVLQSLIPFSKLIAAFFWSISLISGSLFLSVFLFLFVFLLLFFVFLLSVCQAAVYLLLRLLLDNPLLFFFQCCSGCLPDKRSFSCAWNLRLCKHDTVCSLFSPQLISMLQKLSM